MKRYALLMLLASVCTLDPNSAMAQQPIDGKLDTIVFESLDGYEPIEFRACVIEFSKDTEEPVLVVIGESEQTIKYDIRVAPENPDKFKKAPDYWPIRVLGKPKAPEKEKPEQPRGPVWGQGIPLTAYSPPIADDEIKKVIGLVEKATGKKAVQPTYKVLGTKGIEVIGAKKTVRMTFEIKDDSEDGDKK